MAVGRGNAVKETLGLSDIGQRVIKHDHAVDHRDFDIELYKDVRDMSPIFSQTVDEGTNKLKTFENLSEDLVIV